MISRRTIALASALVAGAAVLPAASGGGGEGGKPDLDRIDPVRYKYSQAIVEREIIPARDGITSLALDVIRPKTSRRVPTIFLQSPYYSTLGRGYRHELKLPWGVGVPPNAAGPRTAFPEWYDEHFVPRGYAVVLQDQRGTRNSSGCQVYGGREEITDAVDTIEWIARQGWSNGAVGMTGGSYDGTIAIGAASMRPKALKAIIPIRAIDRWYDYHFFNGLQSAQHFATPAGFTVQRPMTDTQNSQQDDQLYGLHVIERKACAASIGTLVAAQYSSPYQDSRSGFWADRDFLKDAHKITAATFIMHGIKDWNVKTTNALHLWQALPSATPKKLWWFDGEHADPANPEPAPELQFPFPARFKEYTHRWFARYLKGIDTGVTREPPVSVQRGNSWADGLTWPPPAQDRTYRFTGSRLTTGKGSGTLVYGDTGGFGEVVLTGPKLTSAARIAGQPYVSLTYSLAAGGDTTFAYRLIDADTEAEIASGYALGAYREEIRRRGASYPTLPQPHDPGRKYQITFPFIPTDTVVAKGHRLALLIRPLDERVQSGGTGGQVTLYLDRSKLVVPFAASSESEHRRAHCAFAPTSRCPRAASPATSGLGALPAPVDPRSWELPEHMTWADYRPIPGFDWTAPEKQPARKLRAALILGDFADRGFVVTRPKGADPAGNPRGIGSVPRTHVADFYKDFLITRPQALNHYHSVNEYWLEDSYGALGIDADAFGPYRLPGKEHEYGLNEFGGHTACPSGDACGRDYQRAALTASTADVTAGIARNGGRDYDFRFLLHAGYDESGTWQEFGQMKFGSRGKVSAAFGNPDPRKPEWSPTRYVPWTSWWAAKGIWSRATPGVLSIQGENDGASTYAHEFSHILGVLDNYNNPYGEPVQRAYSGPWEMLSRGTFNGPGGPHNRWQIPGTLGGTMGSHHMLRNKIRMGFTKPGEVLTLDRATLAATGPVFAEIWARAVPLGPGTGRTGLRGLQVLLEGGDRTPSCSLAEDWRCDGGGYDNYTVEVVDRMGYDSFTPDHGVLVAKTKNADVAPFIWVADAHPQDINRVDFVRPDGGKAMISKGDYRQLADALFHAGTGPGVVSEFVDRPNGLHFYVLAIRRDAEGVLSYRVAVRALDAATAGRGVSIAPASFLRASPGSVARYTVRVSNRSAATDLVRIRASVPGWTVSVPHAVIEVPAGRFVDVPVFVSIPRGAEGVADLAVSATSETDPTKFSKIRLGVWPA